MYSIEAKVNVIGAIPTHRCVTWGPRMRHCRDRKDVRIVDRPPFPIDATEFGISGSEVAMHELSLGLYRDKNATSWAFSGM